METSTLHHGQPSTYPCDLPTWKFAPTNGRWTGHVLDVPDASCMYPQGHRSALGPQPPCLAKNQEKHQELVELLDAKPQTTAEWKQCFRELDKFQAMKAFITNAPQVVMEIPVADVKGDRQHMIMRAVFDERISSPIPRSMASQISTTSSPRPFQSH